MQVAYVIWSSYVYCKSILLLLVSLQYTEILYLFQPLNNWKHMGAYSAL